MSAICRMLPDGRRLHCNHGPIDVIIEADGNEADIARAYTAVAKHFATILDELVSELPILRTEIPQHGLPLKRSVALSMAHAIQPYWQDRITPMAAVAGAVADDLLRTLIKASPLRRAYVNNGGDIALHLAPNEVFAIASPTGKIIIAASNNIGGIATSGWRGRSFSLGIADAVTVLAATAAKADAAATMIANIVDLPGSHKIKRAPANSISPDTDLRNRLVTIDVAPLTAEETERALQPAIQLAESLLARNLISAASLLLNGTVKHLSSQSTRALHA
jgi:ApbE superfamily uncharacterized protein (UPF0280 family)